MNDEQFTHYQRLLGESLSMEMGLDSAELCLRRESYRADVRGL